MQRLGPVVLGIALAAACGSEEDSSSHSGAGGSATGGLDASTKDGAASGGTGGTAIGGSGGSGGSSGSIAAGGTTPVDASPDVPVVVPDPVVFATADSACNCDGYCNASYGCKSAGVAKLVSQIMPQWLLFAGDLQYESAKLGDFLGTTASTCASCPKPWGFDSQFGTLLPILKPALGNHEYNGNPADDHVRDNYF